MSHHQIKLVIVEDDPMVLEVNKQFVEAIEGFQVIGIARTGTEALSLIQQAHPNLVLLDIYLPDMDGLSTLAEIRKRGLPIDVIMITAARDTDTIQSVFRHGAIDYIVKPFKFDRFKSALDSYRSMWLKLRMHQPLSQEEIDQIAHLKPQDAAGRQETAERKEIFLPKGLNEVTLKQVFLFLIQQQAALSAEEVAEGIGLARVTARRYLDYLEKIGKVELEIQYGSVGRPINRYLVVSQTL